MKRVPHQYLMSKITGIMAGKQLVICVLAILACVAQTLPSFALQAIEVTQDQARIEITSVAEIYDSRGESIQIETAAGGDGVTGRMTVRASTPGANPNWLVFALTNRTDKPIEKWLAADRFTAIGSGIIWPDLDARRIETVTPSIGFVPERIKSDRADIFRLTLEPGQTITYVAELSSDKIARSYLWQPLDYEVKTRDRQLFNGAMLGLTGLLATFLTAIFAANHKLIFPTAALVSWCVLAYLCVDFGFFHKLFALRPEENAVYRSASEAAIAASLLMFIVVFLRLTLLQGLARMLIAVWVIAQLALVAIAAIDPRLASTFARLSFASIGGLGALAILVLATRGQDRALSIVPTWILFLVWIVAAGLTLTGRLSGDIVVSMLVAGLVLIVILIGFTVTQFAFKSLEPSYGGPANELQSRALAIDSSGAAVWEWNIRRDEIAVSPVIDASLGLIPGELSTKVDEFTKHIHQTDRERFRLMLLSAQERAGTRIKSQFRMRHSDNSYRWFELEAASVPNADGRTLRCIGLMRETTDVKRAQERLLHDAVHDSLTGLPNRALFIDRLQLAVLRAKSETNIRPVIIFVDVDKFRSVNSAFGLTRADSLLLNVARRLQRHVGVGDTLARVGGDQFAILFPNGQDPREIGSLAERVRRSLRSPIPIAGQEIVLTGSIGIALYDGEQENAEDLLKEAELAMYRAKRGGSDRIELFHPDMRRERDDRVEIESELRKAIERNQIKVLYQPIIYLPTEELAGFEALVRWEHPRQGLLNPSAFVPIAEESDLIVKLGSQVLLRAAHDAARWHKELPRPDRPLFVSVNVSSKQLFRPDHIQEIRHILGRNIVPRGTLRLEITESLVMENPEQAAELLEILRGAGAEMALDDFGTGYSSLAYLHRFCFDTIKIDKELVSASSSTSGASIMRSMVALSHELGKRVVAEGVEHEDEVAFLRSIGCEYAQGFYFGEPMTDKDVIQVLRMVGKSERKLQPRGFFRSKTRTKKSASGKTKSKQVQQIDQIKDPNTPIAALPSAPSPTSADSNALPDAMPREHGKPASLPGSVVRTKHKGVQQRPTEPPPAPSPYAGHSNGHTNGAQGPATMTSTPPMPQHNGTGMPPPVPGGPGSQPNGNGVISPPPNYSYGATPNSPLYPGELPIHPMGPANGVMPPSPSPASPQFGLPAAALNGMSPPPSPGVPLQQLADALAQVPFGGAPPAPQVAPFTNGSSGDLPNVPPLAPPPVQPVRPAPPYAVPPGVPTSTSSVLAAPVLGQTVVLPDLSKLPPGMANSIARLAGIQLPPTKPPGSSDQS